MTARKPRVVELVSVRWDVGPDAPPLDTTTFERLMRAAVASGLVREWDDGRGRVPWYNARRCREERALRAACVAALGREPSEAP